MAKHKLPPGPGRPKGSKNRFTLLQHAFLDAFDEVGGKKALTAFGKNPRNQAEFFKMITKMLPQKIEADVDVNHSGVLRVPVVDAEKWGKK